MRTSNSHDAALIRLSDKEQLSEYTSIPKRFHATARSKPGSRALGARLTAVWLCDPVVKVPQSAFANRGAVTPQLAGGTIRVISNDICGFKLPLPNEYLQSYGGQNATSREQSPSWDEFSKYYDWEFELVCFEQRHDTSLWIDLAEEFGDPILEVCCGSGRITLPLALKGTQITAVDISEKMLAILEQKARLLDNLEIVQGDMTSFRLNKTFPFAFIGYSSFQSLLTLDEQVKCLNNLRSHLKDGGILGLDICPTTCREKDSDGRIHSYTEYYAPDKTVVSMFTSWKVDRVSQIMHWTNV